MKSPHGHVCVKNLSDRIRYDTVLFAAEPVTTKLGYAKWILDGPGVNVAIPCHTFFTIPIYGEGFYISVNTEPACCTPRSKCQ